MTDRFPPAKQRPRLIELQAALDARAASLGRDECGDWAMSGKLGHIYAVQQRFQLVISTGESARRWTGVKNRLAFCRVTQDGDDDGCMILDRLPSKSEAGLIREAVGIPQARHLSEAHKQKLLRSGTQSRFQLGFSARPTPPATLVPGAPNRQSLRGTAAPSPLRRRRSI
jgi:hypothetical protein